MFFGEVLGLKIQDRLDAERFTPTCAVIEAAPTMNEHESFQMRGLFGEIPGSSYEPIHVPSWSSPE